MSKANRREEGAERLREADALGFLVGSLIRAHTEPERHALSWQERQEASARVRLAYWRAGGRIPKR